MSMRRRAHPVHFARAPIGRQIQRLRSTPCEDWPKHLQLAAEVLQYKPALSRQTALELMIMSMKAAHAFARASNYRSQEVASFRAKLRLKKAFKTVANCARRAPAHIRRKLDRRIRLILVRNPVDLQTIELILDKTAAVFRSHRKDKAAQTALRSMSVKVWNRSRVVWKDDYSTLRPMDQSSIETALREFCKRLSDKLSASNVFKILASALDNSARTKPSADIHRLIVAYVVEVARAWRTVARRPGRAMHPSDPNYRSHFHRFTDLVLTAIVEPRSKRHDADRDEIAKKASEVDRKLPPDLTHIVSATLPRSDIEWIVSEDHIRKALKIIDSKNRH
jgi:hypothetical protein